MTRLLDRIPGKVKGIGKCLVVETPLGGVRLLAKVASKHLEQRRGRADRTVEQLQPTYHLPGRGTIIVRMSS